MEHRCARPEQAAARRRADPPAARPLRARRAPALRRGQMVSGRAAAALGVLAVLAPRRRAALAPFRIARDRSEHARRRPTTKRGRFTEGVATRLGIKPEFVQPAFEDPADRLLKEGLLPANIDPSNPKIDDPNERARIMRAFERHLGKPAGYVLPVQRWAAQAKPGWISEIWQLRRGRLFLAPGDSPIGLAPAAELAALCGADRIPAHGAGRSVRAARAAARRSAGARAGDGGSSRPAARPGSGPQGCGRARGRASGAAIQADARRRRRPPAFRCAPRSRSSRATASSACSCRRSSGWRTISSCSAPSRRPPPSSACRSASKAIRRRTIRASTSSR